MMKSRSFVMAGLVLSTSVVLLMGCGNQNDSNQADDDDWVVVGDDSERDTEKESESQNETGHATEVETDDENMAVFSEMAKFSYIFASGVGGWSTDLTVHEDGSFEGEYSDMDMGETGTDYPNGYCSISSFTGRFSTPEKVNDHTYKTTIQEMNYSNKSKKEEIIDGVKYVYGDMAYGLDGAEDIYIYTKGAPISELPEEYMNWMPFELGENNTQLPWYGIYNEAAQEGFYGTKRDESNTTNEVAETDGQDGISAELTKIENKAQQIEDKLDNDELSKKERKSLSAKLFKLWDDELNDVWLLLDEDTRDNLRQEERDWIKDKEAKMKEAGNSYENKSMQSAAENQKGAQLTRERVYELAQYLE